MSEFENREKELLQRAEHLRIHGKTAQAKQDGDEIYRHLLKARSTAISDQLEMVSYRVNGGLTDVFTWAEEALTEAESVKDEEVRLTNCKEVCPILEQMGFRRIVPGLIPLSDAGVQPMSSVGISLPKLINH